MKNLNSIFRQIFIIVLVCLLFSANMVYAQDNTLFYWVSDKTGDTDDFLAKYAPANWSDCPHFISRVDGMSLQRGAAVAIGNAARSNSVNFQGFKTFNGDTGRIVGAMNSGLMNKSYEFATRDEWKKSWSADVACIGSFKAAGVKKVVMFMQSPLSKGSSADFNPATGGATLAQRIADCVEYADFVESTKPDGVKVTYGLIDAFPSKTLFTADVYHKAYVDLVKAFVAKGYVFEELQIDMKTQTVKNSANALLAACKRAYTEILAQTGQKVRMTWYTWNGGVATDLEANNLLRTALQNIANHPDRAYLTGLLLDGNNEDRNGISDIIPASQSDKYTLTARVNESFSILEKLGVLNPTQKGDPILGSNNGGNVVIVAKPKPSNLATKVVSSNELALTWVDNIASETGYVIERTSEKQADWELLANTDANVSKYNDKTVEPFVLYSYRLRAKYVGDTLSDPTDPVYGRTPAVNPAPLVQPWQRADFGVTNAAMAGSSTLIADTFRINAGDGDFWNTADVGHYVYQSMKGDGSIVAKLVDFDDVQSFSMAGVMMRESITDGSKFAAMLLMSTDGPIMRDRVLTGGAVNQKVYLKTGEHAPYYVKLTRSGDLFEGFISPDGSTWKLIRSITIPMSADIFVGLIASSHTILSNGIYAFANVQINLANGVKSAKYLNGVSVLHQYSKQSVLVSNQTGHLLRISVCNLRGQTVLRASASGGSAGFSTSALGKGVYLVNVTDGVLTATYKIVL